MPTTPQQQPNEWQRMSLKDCATILFVNKSSALGGVNIKKEALANDVVVSLRHHNGSVDMEVELLAENATYENTNKVIIRPKTSDVNPLWIYYTIAQQGFSKSILNATESYVLTSSSIAKAIERFEIAVPTPKVQSEILNMLDMSSGWLKDKAANLRRQSELLEDMEHAITSELLLGKKGPQDVAQWLRAIVDASDQAAPTSPDSKKSAPTLK